jgi:hypothetical protein
MTPTRIEPSTFQFVAQLLNQQRYCTLLVSRLVKFGLQIDFEYTYKLCRKNCRSEIKVSLAEILRLCVTEKFNKQGTSNVHINMILMRLRVNIVAVEKPSIKYSGCVSVALVTQHPKRTLLTLLASVSCQAVPYFSTLTHNEQKKRKK